MKPDPSHHASLHDPGPALRWGSFALASSLLLMGIKFIAYRLTGSSAILSDALESTVNIVTSSFTLYAAWLSRHPQDDDHPYGHGRVEYFSTGLEGIALLGAGSTIAVVVAPELWRGGEINKLELGLGLMLLIGLLALVTGSALIHAGKKHQLATISADGEHIRADAITSLGAFAAIFLVKLTGWTWLDPVTALVISLWLAVSGLKILRRSIAGLMDEADPQELDDIADTLEAIRAPGWLTPHRTKIHRLGTWLHVDMHMVFPRYWSLERTHLAADAIEHAMQEHLRPQTETMLHMEPCTPECCPRCDLQDCPIREAAFTGREAWTGEWIARHRRHGTLEHKD